MMGNVPLSVPPIRYYAKGNTMGRRPEPYRLKKRGKVWYYKLPHETSFHTTEKKSNAKAAEWVERHKLVRKGLNYMYLRDFADQYFTENCPWWNRENARRVDSRPIAISTRNDHRSRYTIHIRPRFGHVRIDEIHPLDIRNWLYDLDYASQTKKHIWRTMIIILDDLAAESLIYFDPRVAIKPPVVMSQTRAVPSGAEINLIFPPDMTRFKSLWGARGWRVGVMMAVCYSCGLRTQEARALDIRAIDWKTKGLKIICAISKDEKKEAVKGNSYRVVLTPERTVMMLRLIIGDRQQGLVFPDRSGKAITHSATWRTLRAVQQKIHLPPDRYFSPHSLRHAYNTRMRAILQAAALEKSWNENKMQIDIGYLSDKILRAFTGHRTERMTEHYDHPDLGRALKLYNDQFREQIEKIWE